MKTAAADVSFRPHLDHIREILARSREANLTVKIRKYQFAKQSIKILGHVIEDELVKSDPDKSTAIFQLSDTEDETASKAFLGLGNFYNRFIPDFGSKTASLTEIIRNDKPHKAEWTDAVIKAFNDIKDDHKLVPPDINKPFILRCDESGTGVGSVLAQLDPRGIELPIGYASRKPKDREARKSTVTRELLYVVWSLNHRSRKP